MKTKVSKLTKNDKIEVKNTSIKTIQPKLKKVQTIPFHEDFELESRRQENGIIL